MFSRILILITFSTLWCINGYSQHFAKKDFDIVNNAADSAGTKDALVARLNGLLKNYMSSGSGVALQFNRQLHGEFYHQRIAVRFYPNNFYINLLTRNDSIFLSTVYFAASPFAGEPGFKDADAVVKTIHSHTAVVAAFLKERNRFYQSHKTANEVAIELSGNDMYAMNCGDGAPLTAAGKRLHDLLKQEDPFPEITGMLQNLSCEVQAYGVTAVDLLMQKGVAIDDLNNKLYQYIRKRNATVVTCSGHLAGIKEKLYDNK